MHLTCINTGRVPPPPRTLGSCRYCIVCPRALHSHRLGSLAYLQYSAISEGLHSFYQPHSIISAQWSKFRQVSRVLRLKTRPTAVGNRFESLRATLTVVKASLRSVYHNSTRTVFRARKRASHPLFGSILSTFQAIDTALS